METDSGMAPETLARISDLLERAHRTLTQPSPWAEILARDSDWLAHLDPNPARFEFDRNMREWMGADPTDPGGQPDPAPAPWMHINDIGQWTDTRTVEAPVWVTPDPTSDTDTPVDAKPKRLSWWANE